MNDMDKIDIPISKEVANKASKEINNLQNKVVEEKDVQLSLLQDILCDVRDQRGFFKKLCIILCVFVFTLIVGFISVSFHNQSTLKELSKENTELFLDFLKSANVQIDTSNIPND